MAKTKAEIPKKIISKPKALAPKPWRFLTSAAISGSSLVFEVFFLYHNYGFFSPISRLFYSVSQFAPLSLSLLLTALSQFAATDCCRKFGDFQSCHFRVKSFDLGDNSMKYIHKFRKINCKIPEFCITKIMK